MRIARRTDISYLSKFVLFIRTQLIAAEVYDVQVSRNCLRDFATWEEFRRHLLRFHNFVANALPNERLYQQFVLRHG